VIVILSGDRQETKEITSGVEKQLRRAAGSRAAGRFESQKVPADDSREREYTGSLARYYDEVISALRSASDILLFGPGEAKGELKKRIERDRLDLRISRVVTADKMSGRQVIEKVREYYFPRVVGKKSRARLQGFGHFGFPEPVK